MAVVTVAASRAVLDARELVPFQAAVAAGARVAMSAHIALPAVTGSQRVPATLSRAAMTDLLRGELGFDGVSITDALDMAGVGLRDGTPDVVAAIRAGVDLLLTAADPAAREAIEGALVDAASRGSFDTDEMAATERRLAALQEWLASFGDAPELDVVGSPGHRDLAAELAARLDDAGPRSVRAAARPVVDLRARPRGHAATDRPDAGRHLVDRPAGACGRPSSIPWRRGRGGRRTRSRRGVDRRRSGARAAAADLAVIGTIDAHRLRAQLDMVDAVAATGTPTIVVAMRGPWDVAAVPAGVTALATYSILPGSLDAFAAVLDGADAPGRLPVRV